MSSLFVDGGGGDDHDAAQAEAAAAQHVVVDKKGRAVAAVNSKGRRNPNFVRLQGVERRRRAAALKAMCV